MRAGSYGDVGMPSGKTLDIDKALLYLAAVFIALVEVLLFGLELSSPDDSLGFVGSKFTLARRGR